MALNPILVFGGLVEKEEQPKISPINPTIVMVKVQQALTDAGTPTYIIVSGYRKYTDEIMYVEFERGISPLMDRERKFNKWVVTNMYIPATEQIKMYSTKTDKKMVVMDVPKEFFFEVLVRKSINEKTAVAIKNHIIDGGVTGLYRFVKERKNRTACVGLTEKNWTVISTQPDFSKMIKFVNGKPITKYAISNVWRTKVKPVVDTAKIGFDPSSLIDSVCSACGGLNDRHAPHCVGNNGNNP